MNQITEEEAEERLPVTPTEKFSNLTETMTIDYYQQLHEVKTKDQLLEKIQKFIDSGKPWQWNEKKNGPVICDLCKRTVKRDGYSHKHLIKCMQLYPETFS